MTTILDMDAMLDQTLDNVEDVADFVTPPAGNYVLGHESCAVDRYKSKDGSEGVRIKAQLKVVSTVELEGEALPVADGSLFSLTWQATEDGLKYFKKYAKQVLNVEDLDGVTLRDIMASVADVKEFNARVTIRRSPKEGGGEYENVQVRPTPAA